jgi:propanol-preferring alcohol dehydrogenase
VVPGHQVIGSVEDCGPGTKRLQKGDRVGVAWIYSSCGTCRFCRDGDENLCERFVATGRDADGGYAEYMVVPEAFAFTVPDTFSDAEAAPLLCAGTIGYRSLRLTGMRDGENIGLIGFGASAHLVIQMVRHMYPSSKVFVFARSRGRGIFPGNSVLSGRAYHGQLTGKTPSRNRHDPRLGTIVHALGNLERGGRLVINAIRKEEIDKADLLGLPILTISG